MKILHINDVCANAYILSKFYRKLGHESHVFVMHSWDNFGFRNAYADYVLASSKDGEDKFIDEAIAKSHKYDLVHVHAFPKLFHYLNLKKSYFILHYWGSDARDRDYNNIWRQQAEEKANIVLAGNPDLPNYIKYGNVKYIPIPVDTDMFYPNSIGHGAFTFGSPNWDMDGMRYYLRKYGYTEDFNVIDRTLNGVSHKSLPDFIRQYQRYIDVKIMRGTGLLLPCHSATGLQALACGLEVVNHEVKVKHGLPEEHKGINVCQTILEAVKR